METALFKTDTVELELEIADTTTGQNILNALPISGSAQTWGDEIYFYFNVRCDLEPEATDLPDFGDLGYWPSGPAFCLFFGPTPVSTNDKPRAASAVNIFGSFSMNEVDKLKSVKDGDQIQILRK